MSEEVETVEMSVQDKIEFLCNKMISVVGVLDLESPTEELDDEGKPKLPSEMDQIKRLAARMAMLGQVYDVMKPVLTMFNDEYDRIRKGKLPDLMAETECRTATFEGIGRLSLAADCYASIPADQQATAFQWLRDNKYGDLIKETVNSGTLKSWAMEGLSNGREMPEDVFKITPYSRASITKIKAKAPSKAKK